MKITLPLLSLFSLLFLVSCSGNNNDQNPEILQPEQTDIGEIENSEVDNGPFDFRRVRWGMPKADVIKSEELEFTEGGGFLMADLSVGGLKSGLGYQFVENSLVLGIYDFRDKHTDSNRYMYDFRSIQMILIDKYGFGESDIRWTTTRYQGNPERLGLAISLGHVVYSHKWENESTKIIHVMTGDNYKIDHTVNYLSKKHLSLLESQSKENNSADF